MSQRLFAFSHGWSMNQFKRIEGGKVAPRFGPVWQMCFMAQINPLWLAFGEPNLRYACANYPVFEKHPELTPEMLFITVMNAIEAEYRAEDEKLEWGGRPTAVKRPEIFVLRERLAELTAKFAERVAPADRARFCAYLAASADRFLAGKAISNKVVDTQPKIQNKCIFMADSRDSYWQQLRKTIVEKTTQRGARAALARLLGVSPQALNEWLQDRSAPPAEQTLRLLRWVEQGAEQPQQQKCAGRASTRPAPKTRKEDQNDYEKSKSRKK